MPLPNQIYDGDSGASPFSVPHPEPASATVYQLQPKHRMAEPFTLRMPPLAPAEGWVDDASVENDRVVPNSQSMSMATEGEVRTAEIAAAEARGDTKIARMEGKLDLVLSKLDHVNERIADVKEDGRSTRANIWVVGLGLAVLIVAMITLLPVVFDLGSKFRETITKEIQEQTHRPALPATPQK